MKYSMYEVRVFVAVAIFLIHFYYSLSGLNPRQSPCSISFILHFRLFFFFFRFHIFFINETNTVFRFEELSVLS